MNYTGPQAASYPRLGGHLKFFRFSIQLIGEAVVTCDRTYGQKCTVLSNHYCTITYI